MDIRKDLPKITVPFAFVSPYNASDFAAMNISEEAKHAYVAGLLQGVPQLSMIKIQNARHFAMLDQPTIFNQKLAEFLAGVK